MRKKTRKQKQTNESSPLYPSKEALQKGLELTERQEELLAERDKLDERIIEVNRELAETLGEVIHAVTSNGGSGNGGGGGGTVSLKKPPVQEQPSGGRRKLKDVLTNTLKAAGQRGITVTELANRLRLPKGNVSAWLAITGKKNPAIERIAPAHYRFNRSRATA